MNISNVTGTASAGIAKMEGSANEEATESSATKAAELQKNAPQQPAPSASPEGVGGKINLFA